MKKPTGMTKLKRVGGKKSGGFWAIVPIIVVDIKNAIFGLLGHLKKEIGSEVHGESIGEVLRSHMDDFKPII